MYKKPTELLFYGSRTFVFLRHFFCTNEFEKFVFRPQKCKFETVNPRPPKFEIVNPKPLEPGAITLGQNRTSVIPGRKP